LALVFELQELYPPRALTSFHALIHASESTFGAVTTNGNSLLIDIRLLWADILVTSNQKEVIQDGERLRCAGDKKATNFRTKVAWAGRKKQTLYVPG
jgi:hypothetical protein